MEKENNYFYCYSNKLMYFLKAYGISYINTDKSDNNKQFWIFEKSQKLDNVISFWNEVKHKFINN